jgi:hypothetical protein
VILPMSAFCLAERCEPMDWTCFLRRVFPYRLAWNLGSSCLSLWSTGIRDVLHHTFYSEFCGDY